MIPPRHPAASTRCFVIALATMAAPLHGQETPDGAPIVVGDDEEWEVLHLYGIDAALELEWRRNVDSVEPANGSKRTDREDRLRPILELRTDGFIGQPDLLEFDLGGRFWPEQRWLSLDSTGQTEHINQTLWEWDVSGAFIKESVLPVTVYTRQNFSDVDRQFGGSLENRFRETGVRLSLRNSVVPTNVQLFQRDIEQRDLAAGTDFNIDQKTLRADGRVERAANQRLAWSIVHDDVDESGDLRVPQSFRRFEGKLQHAFDFGEDLEHTLRTNVRLFDEKGFRDFSQLRIAPRLRLRHSADLQSWYDYTYQRDDFRDQDQRFNEFTANVQHQLFDSLTTIANAGWNRFRITTDDFDSDEIFGRVDFNYVKEAGARADPGGPGPRHQPGRPERSRHPGAGYGSGLRLQPRRPDRHQRAQRRGVVALHHRRAGRHRLQRGHRLRGDRVSRSRRDPPHRRRQHRARPGGANRLRDRTRAGRDHRHEVVQRGLPLLLHREPS